MKPEDQFHVAIVATEFEATQAALTAAFGYAWGPEVGAPTALTTPDGDRVVNLRCAYTVDAPRLEIIRSVPGTLWEAVSGVGIHHVGYWSDDVAADAAELAAVGYAHQASRVEPDGVPSFAFYRNPAGLLVELVSRSLQPGLSQCWARPSVDGGAA